MKCCCCGSKKDVRQRNIVINYVNTLAGPIFLAKNYISKDMIIGYENDGIYGKTALIYMCISCENITVEKNISLKELRYQLLMKQAARRAF